MKRILTILGSLLVVTSSASVAVSCTSDPMSRDYKQRVDPQDLTNKTLNDLFIKNWNLALNKYVRATPEEVQSWEDANNILKTKVGYAANRYITSMASDLILLDTSLPTDALESFRKIHSYYTLKSNLVSTELEMNDENEITGIFINVQMELNSPRDWEFLDSWVKFKAYLPLVEFGDLPVDFLTELNQVSHLESKTNMVWKGKYDENGKPLFEEEITDVDVYDFASFEVKADNYEDLTKAKFKVKENNSDAEFTEIKTVGDFADFVIKKIEEQNGEGSLWEKYQDKVDLSIEFKMPNNDIFEKNQNIAEVARFLSSSLIYITATSKDQSNKKLESVWSAEGTIQMLFDDEKIGQPNDKGEK